MARAIKTWRDPYDAGFSTTRPKEISIEPGLTVFVGCNGAGKTTLIQNVQSELKQQKIPVVFYNNLTAKDNIKHEAFSTENFAMIAGSMASSEGEESMSAFCHSLIIKARQFFKDGEIIMTNADRFAKIFRKSIDEDKGIEIPNERWILIDALDSGMSIDAVCELKDVFELMLEDAKQMGLEAYIVISANEYELARGTNCFDVTTGKYLNFNDYEEFRKFILASRKKKDKRNEKIANK